MSELLVDRTFAVNRRVRLWRRRSEQRTWPRRGETESKRFAGCSPEVIDGVLFKSVRFLLRLRAIGLRRHQAAALLGTFQREQRLYGVVHTIVFGRFYYSDLRSSKVQSQGPDRTQKCL